MIDINIGAVGAAIIAGFVSFLGLIIGKEQKVSEFRQAWIDDLRKHLVNYLVSINAIADALQLQKATDQAERLSMLPDYKMLNEASHSVTLRVNADEAPAKAVLRSMSEFEAIAGSNINLTPERIRAIETDFIEASKKLLKFEWRRVKRGETTFVWTKRIVFLFIVIMLFIFTYLLSNQNTVGIDGSDRHNYVESSRASCTGLDI